MPLLSRRASSAAQGLGLNSIGKLHFATQTYSTAGTYTFRVPIGNNSVKLTYPTTSGMVTTTVAVTQNTDVTVTIGTYAATSSFGSTTIPAYTKKVLDHTSGNVDANLNQTFSVATTNVSTVTTSGGNSTVVAAMSAGGIYFNYDQENAQGDFGENITVDTVPISTLLAAYRVTGAVSSSTPNTSITILTQPTSGNSYRTSIQVGEGGYSNNLSLYSVTIEQVGYLQISEAT